MKNNKPKKSKVDNFLSTPIAIVECNRNFLFASWTTLENQLKQLDKNQDSEMYRELDEIALVLYNAWIQVGSACRGA